MKAFQSTLSLRRATAEPFGPPFLRQRFQSTLSLRRATGVHPMVRYLLSISIHALLAESDLFPRYGDGGDVFISIHALLAESDGVSVQCRSKVVISIHALLAESDVAGLPVGLVSGEFQSTLSLRRATVSFMPSAKESIDFNPRSPCGERPDRRADKRVLHLFQSTLSLRRATGVAEAPLIQFPDFNPRSPCGERLYHDFLQIVFSGNFNPRSPCGERRGGGGPCPPR